MSSNNGASATFGFGTQSTETNKPKEETPVVSTEIKSGVVEDPDLDKSYTDKRSVTIALVTNYSLYRKTNDKVLSKRKDYIGSSVKSSRILSANKGEVEAYMPNILGISPNNERFVGRVKQYLNNIRIGVDELGKKFNTTFIYNTKRDYLEFKAKEEKIEAMFAKANRSNIEDIRKALDRKITDLNTLEGEKYKVGYPEDVDDYLMYRHCLLYSDVAKDMSLINSTPNIRFYIKDDAKELEKMKKHRKDILEAKSNFVSCMADDEMFMAVYIQYCVLSNLPIPTTNSEPHYEMEAKLDKFSTDEPVKFNKIFKDPNIKTMASIEKLIAIGELSRYEHNQNIVTPNGDFIGANISEAIAWFNNPDNKSIVNGYMNKLKNI